MVAAVILAVASCKKKDDEVEIVYVDGTLTFELPEFIHPGQVIKMTPKGLTHPDGKEIGYYWKVSPSMAKYDTTRFLTGLGKDGKASDGSLTHKFSDTLQTYTVYCYGFSEDYSTSTKFRNTTVVAAGPEKTITGTGISSGTDPHIKINGIEYYYTTIGNLDWFRQDLAYTTTGIPFRNGEPMDGVFGRYYNHEEALKAITIYPAEHIGIADRVGTLEAGKDADLVVYEGDPLDSLSKIHLVLIDGERITG
jgi:hypothetical protein